MKHSMQNTLFGPATGAPVNAAPFAEPLGKPTPFAAVFRHIQTGMNEVYIGYADIAPLSRQQMFDDFERRFCNFQPSILIKFNVDRP